MPDADVLVLGAGAAGLMAGIRAAALGARTIVLEKNRKPGAKILASGGGRCNLTTTLRGHALEAAFREGQGRFLRFALRALPPDRLLAWFAGHGVTTHVEEMEKVFPDAGRASVVLEALLAGLAEHGGRLMCGRPAEAVHAGAGGGLVVETPGGALQATRVVLAVGGRSWPRTGTTGDGYTIARAAGHRVTELFPALVGLRVSDPDLRGLAGLTLGDARLSLADAPVVTSRRPLLFTHEGLSGPAAMDVSGAVAARGGADLRLDLAPERDLAALDRDLASAARTAGRGTLVRALFPELPRRLREVLLARAGVALDAPAAELTRERRGLLGRLAKDLALRASGTLGWDRAEVTRGGVALEEVDPKSFASRKLPGLHLVGEVLDVDGPIGGFNFQAGFATGWAGGEAAARAAPA